ncbi:MAG: hypothetical protein QY314_01595 [Candidatus Dojkabacteria bacterium]|nr:MAG: hypothetical protein QY314_01595 [Candidatus Dojkabacteria bacterium]
MDREYELQVGDIPVAVERAEPQALAPEVQDPAIQWITEKTKIALGDAGEFIDRMEFADAVVLPDKSGFNIPPAIVYYKHLDRYLCMTFSNINVTEEEMNSPLASLLRVNMQFMSEEAYHKDKTRRDAILRGEISAQESVATADTSWSTELVDSIETMRFAKDMVHFMGKMHPSILVCVTPSDERRHRVYRAALDRTVEPRRRAMAMEKGLPYTPISMPPIAKETAA